MHILRWSGISIPAPCNKELNRRYASSIRPLTKLSCRFGTYGKRRSKGPNNATFKTDLPKIDCLCTEPIFLCNRTSSHPTVPPHQIPFLSAFECRLFKKEQFEKCDLGNRFGLEEGLVINFDNENQQINLYLHGGCNFIWALPIVGKWKRCILF